MLLLTKLRGLNVMIFEYEFKDWEQLSNNTEETQIEFSIFDENEPIIDSDFDNFDEREISCLTKVNLQMN